MLVGWWLVEICISPSNFSTTLLTLVVVVIDSCVWPNNKKAASWWELADSRVQHSTILGAHRHHSDVRRLRLRRFSTKFQKVSSRNQQHTYLRVFL